MRRGVRSERRQLAEELRARGHSWTQIAEALRGRWPELTPRAALRVAHGWSQKDTANEWNRLWSDEKPKEAKDFSGWERWPEGGRRPSLQVLERLAQLYQVSVADLVADIGDHRSLDRQFQQRASSPAGRSQPQVMCSEGRLAGSNVAAGWLVAEQWHTTGGVDRLAQTVDHLEDLASSADGSLREQVLLQLGWAHQSLGDGAFDQLRFIAAIGHFQWMHELGVEIDDPDLVTLALTHQADVARRRRRYGTADRLLDASEPASRRAAPWTRARRWQTVARAYAERCDRRTFLEAIDQAERWINEPHYGPQTAVAVTSRDIRFERAHGLTLLGHPTEALAIYADTPQSFSSGRERTSFTIIYAQALAHAGELAEGTRLAMAGLAEARAFGSTRFVSRVQRLYDRLVAMHSVQDPYMVRLHDALATAA